MDPGEKEQLLVALINQLRPLLQAAGVAPSNLEDLATHNEWGVALDALLWAIDEHALLLTPEQYQDVVSLGTAMHMDPSAWQRIDAQGLVEQQASEPPDEPRC